MGALVIQKYAVENNRYIFPHIAPGTYIGPNSTIIGAVWVDCAIIRHAVSIRGDYLEPSGNSFSPNPNNEGRIPFSVIIGNRVLVDDEVVIHPTRDLDQPVILRNEAVIGHNTGFHGFYMGEGATIFVSSTVSENASLQRRSILSAGSVLGSHKVIPEEFVFFGAGKSAGIMSARQDQLDRTIATINSNTIEAVRTIQDPDNNWQYFSDLERRTLNLSKLLYSLEAMKEIFHEIPNDELFALVAQTKEMVEQFYDLDTTPGRNKPTLSQEINTNLRQISNTLTRLGMPTEITIPASTIRLDQNLNPSEYTYDVVQIANIVSFVELAANAGIEQIHSFNEYAQGTGITGPWAYYGINHSKQFFPVKPDQTIELDPKIALQALTLQAPNVKFYLEAQSRIFIELLVQLDGTEEFIALINTLDDIANERPIANPQIAGRLIVRAPEIIAQLALTENGEQTYQEAKLQHDDLQALGAKFRRIINSDLKQACSFMVNAFNKNFPALYYGVEILPAYHSTHIVEPLSADIVLTNIKNNADTHLVFDSNTRTAELQLKGIIESAINTGEITQEHIDFLRERVASQTPSTSTMLILWSISDLVTVSVNSHFDDLLANHTVNYLCRSETISADDVSFIVGLVLQDNWFSKREEALLEAVKQKCPSGYKGQIEEIITAIKTHSSTNNVVISNELQQQLDSLFKVRQSYTDKTIHQSPALADQGRA